MKRKLLSLALALCMALSQLPMTAMAAADENSIQMGLGNNKQYVVTLDNFDNPTSGIGWSWSGSPGYTLTLTGAYGGAPIAIFGTTPVTLEIVDNVTISEANQHWSTLFSQQSLTITGSGNLTATGPGTVINVSSTTFVSNLTINMSGNGSVTSLGGNPVYLTNGTLSVTGGSLVTGPENATSLPAISAITPNTGTEQGGTSITLTGTNLTGASSVTVGGVAATNVNVVDDSTITFTTPAGTAGAANVKVTATGGAVEKSSIFTYIDDAPIITAGTVSRTSDTEATVKFTSNEAGQYYYEVVEDNAGDPNINTTGAGTACGTSEVTIANPTGLTAGAKDIWIYVKDAAGNVGKLKIDLPAYVPPSTDATLKTLAGQIITAGSEAGTDATPKTATVSVTNSVSSLKAANVVPNDTNAAAKFGKDIAALGVADIPLSEGDNIVYIEVTAEDTTTKLYYKVTITRAKAQSNNTGGNSSPVTTPSKTTEISGVDYTMGTDGTVTLKPTTAQLDKQIAAIPESGVLSITVAGIEGMKGAIIEIDLTKLVASEKLQVFNFSVADMSVNFPTGALKSMQKLAKTLRFGLKPGSLIFELTDQNGKDIKWYDYENPVTISMDYEPPQDISTHQIVMIHKDGTVVPRSWYSGGKVYAKIHEPGTYDAAVKSLGGFTDTAGLWMDEAVGYMAARSIVEGVGDNLFDRSGTITRAHFITMLMRALDVEIDASTLEAPYTDFADIPEWAQPHVITAKALGITLADEDNKVNPNEAITRQEMFFMAYEAMGACGMLPEIFTEQWIIFSDWDGENGVKPEYGDAIQNLCKLGLVKGNGDGTLNPNGSSTRAEGAQFLYNILKYDAK